MLPPQNTTDLLQPCLDFLKYGGSGVAVYLLGQAEKSLARRREESSAVQVARINARVAEDTLLSQRVRDLEVQQKENIEQIRSLTTQLYSMRVANDELTVRRVGDVTHIQELQAKLEHAERELARANVRIAHMERQLILAGITPALADQHPAGQVPPPDTSGPVAATEGDRPTDGAKPSPEGSKPSHAEGSKPSLTLVTTLTQTENL